MSYCSIINAGHGVTRDCGPRPTQPPHGPHREEPTALELDQVETIAPNGEDRLVGRTAATGFMLEPSDIRDAAA